MNLNIKEKIPKILDRYPRRESSLIMVLQDVQEELNYLSTEALIQVAAELDVPQSKVFGVATFYKAFSLTPRGKKTVKICTGTACHVRGAPIIKDEIERMLGIPLPGTTEDLEYTVELVNCVGACAMAPVVVAGDKYHANVKPDRLKKIFGKRAEKNKVKRQKAKGKRQKLNVLIH